MTAGDDPAPVLVVRRWFAAPRERVFAAWLDPASLARWMRPHDHTRTTVELDARVGGKFRIAMIHEQGENTHEGEYLAIEPPARLAFTWASANTDHSPTVVTVELLEKDAGTELILTHRRLPPAQVTAHREGWIAILRRLGAALAVATD